MINHKEAAICKRRGHDPQGHRDKWERCKYCGMWSRTINVKEEREDEPPEEERDQMYNLKKEMSRFSRSFDQPDEIQGRKPSKGKKAK